jgi:hypothetical protein
VSSLRKKEKMLDRERGGGSGGGGKYWIWRRKTEGWIDRRRKRERRTIIRKGASYEQSRVVRTPEKFADFAKAEYAIKFADLRFADLKSLLAHLWYVFHTLYYIFPVQYTIWGQLVLKKFLTAQYPFCRFSDPSK